MASRRAALALLSVFSGSEDFWPEDSSSLHSGQRFANPGLPGFSSNSSPQTTQVLIGYGMFFMIPRRMGTQARTGKHFALHHPSILIIANESFCHKL